MPTFIFRCSALLLVLVFGACKSAGVRSCDANSQIQRLSSPQAPSWVGDYAYRVPGYYTGQAAVSLQDSSIQLAESLALASLSKSIQLNVKVAERYSTQVKGGQVTIYDSAGTDIESEISLPGYTVHQAWFQPQGCQYHVLIKASIKDTQDLLNQQVAEQLFSLAQNQSKDYTTRVSAVKDALALAQRINYAVIPGDYPRSHYVNKYRQLQTQLVQRRNHSVKSGTKALLIMDQSSSTRLPERHYNELIQAFSSQLKNSKPARPVSCADMQECMQLASRTSSSTMLLLKIDTEVKKQSFFSQVHAKLVVEQVDLLSRQSKPSPVLEVKILSQGSDAINWNTLITLLSSVQSNSQLSNISKAAWQEFLNTVNQSQ